MILVGILVFDLVDRRFTNSLWLPAFAAAGGVLGHLAELGIARAGFVDRLHDVLVHVQGHEAVFNRTRLMTNWPVLFSKGSDYIGAAIGIMLGTGVYFAIFGKFRRGSSLFLHMALGWFAGFLLLPVLLDIRMTPPRGDNWAGILGVYAGVLIYSVRHKLWPIVVVSLVTGTIGGIGFSGIACLQALLESFGNGNLAPGLAAAWTKWQTQAGSSAYVFPAILLNVKPAPGWQFWHEANWHSFLEQSYGFVNGVGVIVGMGLLVRRIGPLDNQAKRHYWPEIVALTLVLPILLYVNLVKNVADWTRVNPSNVIAAVPKVMRMPLIGFPLSAMAWFNILFGMAAIALVMLLSVHTRRRLALLEQSWLGRGQLLFVVLLWAFVIGNFGKALPGFTEQRLLTEGVITLNAVFATIMLFLLPRSAPELPPPTTGGFDRLIGGSLAAAVLCAALVPPLETFCVRAVYGDAPVRHAGKNVPETRFGPHANWKQNPALKRLRPPVARRQDGRRMQFDPTYPSARNGDRESGRFSQLPADRCASRCGARRAALTSFFCALTAVLRLQFVCSSLLSSGEPTKCLSLLVPPSLSRRSGEIIRRLSAHATETVAKQLACPSTDRAVHRRPRSRFYGHLVQKTGLSVRFATRAG